MHPSQTPMMKASMMMTSKEARPRCSQDRHRPFNQNLLLPNQPEKNQDHLRSGQEDLHWDRREDLQRTRTLLREDCLLPLEPALSISCNPPTTLRLLQRVHSHLWANQDLVFALRQATKSTPHTAPQSVLHRRLSCTVNLASQHSHSLSHRLKQTVRMALLLRHHYCRKDSSLHRAV